MQDLDFAAIVGRICRQDARYNRKAYEFVRLGLDATVKELRKKNANRAEAPRHVSGQDLLNGLRVYALDQYGPLARAVLESWGVRRCRDFGEIVFNLIEHKVFTKNEKDRREDFDDLYDFDEAFVKPFLPLRPRGAEARGPA